MIKFGYYFDKTTGFYPVGYESTVNPYHQLSKIVCLCNTEQQAIDESARLNEINTPEGLAKIKAQRQRYLFRTLEVK